MSDPQPVYLSDYQPPAYQVTHTELTFDLDPAATRVKARLLIERNENVDAQTPLVLNGEQLSLISLAIDGTPLAEADYQLDEGSLRIMQVPAAFSLESEVEIAPGANTALEGLYQSSGMYCTQCEAEGFRRITFYPDRPDVMATFTVTVIGDQNNEPVLLANGNPVDSGILENGRHFVKWEDPHPKPCYLFALVAGDLHKVEDHFSTMSGRDVTLQIWVEEENLDKTEHAMASLKRSMAWDEQTYGREYDLDLFMIVAVNDFNMGAMENKGLNIFNSAAVLTHPNTATDATFQNVEGIGAHEYFHNWSGNRVATGDWFKASLKEGFTRLLGTSVFPLIPTRRRLRYSRVSFTYEPLCTRCRPRLRIRAPDHYIKSPILHPGYL